MKLIKRPALFVSVLLGIAFSSNALAAGGIPESLGKPIRSESEAKQVPTGAKVMLACAKCKTVILARVDQNRSFLSWFTPKTRHECPGCGGKMEVERYGPFGNPAKGSAQSWYTHTCSICGANSAACSTNAPGHKAL